MSTSWWSRGTVAIMRREKGPRLYISKFRSNEFYSTESWRIGIERFGGTHHEILRMHLVRNWNSGKKRAIWRRCPKRRPEGTSRQADCTSKAAQNLARKICKLNAEDNYVLFFMPCDASARPTEYCHLTVFLAEDFQVPTTLANRLQWSLDSRSQFGSGSDDWFLDHFSPTFRSDVCSVQFSTTAPTQVLGLSVASPHCVREPPRMPRLFLSNTHWMLSWNTKLVLSSLIRHRTHWEKMLTMFDPPLARALLSQTQLLTRLRLFLAAVSSNAVHPLFALQHTIDTVCDRARVPKHCATSSLQLGVSPGLWEFCCALMVHLRPTCLSPQSQQLQIQHALLSTLLVRSLLVTSKWVPARFSFSTTVLKVWLPEEHSTAESHVKFFPAVFWQSNIGPSRSTHRNLSPTWTSATRLIVSCAIHDRQLWPFLLHCRSSSVSFRAVAFLLLAMVSFHSINESRKPSPWPLLNGHTWTDASLSIMVSLLSSRLIVFFPAGHLRDLGQSFPLQQEHFVFDVSDVPSFGLSLPFPLSLPLRLPSSFAFALAFAFASALALVFAFACFCLSLSKYFWVHHTPAVSSRSVWHICTTLNPVGCAPVLLLLLCPGACPRSEPRTAVQDSYTPPRLDLCFPWEDTAAIASASLDIDLCSLAPILPEIVSRSRVHSLYRSVSWSSGLLDFSCASSTWTQAALLASLEHRSFQTRTILPLDSLPHLRVPPAQSFSSTASVSGSFPILRSTGFPLYSWAYWRTEVRAAPASSITSCWYISWSCWRSITEQIPPPNNNDAAAPEYQKLPGSVNATTSSATMRGRVTAWDVFSWAVAELPSTLKIMVSRRCTCLSS